MPKIVDLVGKRYGKLVVKRKLSSRRDGSVVWECLCDCGNLYEANTRHLNRAKNNVKSCGCSQHPKGKSNPLWGGVGEISADWWHSKIGREFSQKSRARIPVEIDMQYAWDLYLEQEGKCALTGLPLSFGRPISKGTASLDRIDNTKGYIPGNVQWVHKVINMMKRTYDQDYFIEMCKLVAKHDEGGACPIR